MTAPPSAATRSASDFRSEAGSAIGSSAGSSPVGSSFTPRRFLTPGFLGAAAFFVFLAAMRPHVLLPARRAKFHKMPDADRRDEMPRGRRGPRETELEQFLQLLLGLSFVLEL